MDDHQGEPSPWAKETALTDIQKKLEAYIEQEEGASHRFQGIPLLFLCVLAVLMSLFHLYAAYEIVPTQLMRSVHVAMVLALIFLLFPVARRFRDQLHWWDFCFALVPLYIAWYMYAGGDDFTDRNTSPLALDIGLGIALIVLILEAVRRTSGWVMVIVTSGFLFYALLGAHFPQPWTHKGYDLGRLVGHMFMTLEGIFGVAVDVSSSLIVLFSIFGAFLQFSGAGKFFIDFSFAAMGGRPTGVGRTVVLASFLLGGPSGSGVATTVTIGTVAYPMLAKAGYEKNAAGGLLAAAGLGAIISPPVLGAAAFLIAEFLKLSYLDVLLMACIPTLLFYVSLFIMVEIDARKYGMRDASFEAVESVWGLASRYWFHFFSLVSIIVFMLMGFSPTMSVLYATGVSLLTSFFRADTSLIPYQLLKPSERPWYERILDVGLIKALQGGAVGTLGVAVTCACAGLIVGTVTLTGLGLKFSGIVIEYAAGSLLLTAIYTALIVWVVGLAVPVTASYIICAVVAAPALIKLGVPDFAAHMFIFYYAVLSEVSPPTALSPFAAAAITGGDPYKTTLQSWKYTLPAFLVPFVFVLDPQGVGLLLMGSMKALGDASMASIAWISLSTALGILAMSGAFQGWLLVRVNLLERMLLIFAGIALVFRFDYNTSLGIAALTIVLLWQGLRSR
nr:TRAP transporter fused permease subunit [Betaproteobacteria bacterium]